jgi:hypothetical protein
MDLRNVKWVLGRMTLDNRKEMPTGDPGMATFKASANLNAILTNCYKPASCWTKFARGIVLGVSLNFVDNNKCSFARRNNV